AGRDESALHGLPRFFRVVAAVPWLTGSDEMARITSSMRWSMPASDTSDPSTTFASGGASAFMSSSAPPNRIGMASGPAQFAAAHLLQGKGERREHLLVRVLHHRAQEDLARLEVVVEHAEVDPGGIGHLAHRKAGTPAVREELATGGEQRAIEIA